MPYVLKQPRTKKVEKSRKPVETTLGTCHAHDGIGAADCEEIVDTIHDDLMVILILAMSCMWHCTSSTFRQNLPPFFRPQTGIIHILINDGGNGS
jgi:hypothetical protein